MAGNLDRKLRLPRIHFRVLLHAANMRHGTNGFTSLPKEGVLRIFSPWKIRRLRPGLNQRTWIPKDVQEYKSYLCSAQRPSYSWIHTHRYIDCLFFQHASRTQVYSFAYRKSWPASLLIADKHWDTTLNRPWFSLFTQYAAIPGSPRPYGAGVGNRI